MPHDATRVLPHREHVPGLERIARWPGAWFPLLWLPILLAGPVIQAAIDLDWLRGLALLVFGAAFAGTVQLPFRAGRRWHAELAFAGLIVLFVVYFALWQRDSAFLHPLMAIGAAVAVRPRLALGVVVGLTISGATALGIERGSLEDAMLLGFATLMAGGTSFLVQRLVQQNRALRRLQRQLAQAAVAEERQRFSRDLHDLLGHTLSVIVVKAEAVRRLAERDPRAAAAHAAEIETVGRHALAEVRQVVSGYRAASLADAIEAARSALAPRGIALRANLPEQPLEEETDALLGWIVREGTTNVLRHARGAATCRVTVAVHGDTVRIEVRDDGGADPVDAHADGSGLAGLRERVDRFGGVLTAGASPDGYRLAATVPLRDLPAGTGPTHPERTS
ncbi:sensor histidine kinase [Agrococcus sp. ARC_14]|uniref:sensor histidine kinase n=1 Tax=Agrococcus sp. ARC_14 TaxID=2919927 RepID=UPI001F064923|nr:sensor histidine kinase [Agrococcus sp. ARC_14]MCH1882311.1 sensor histidine kinase [Agrococcus sp. ARC_14]